MGFATLIDLLGSIIIGGLLFMILMRMNDSSVENTYRYSGDLMVQQNLVAVVQLLEHDFRKIGYCKVFTKIPIPTQAILLADSTRIKFLSDVATDKSSEGLKGDGNVDTVSYYLGPASELTKTANPRDRYLYRVINGATPKGVNLGVTQFRILYFNALGDTIHFPVTNTGEIYTMQINLKVENTAAYNYRYTQVSAKEPQYSSAFWRQIRLAARNIRNR
jgi:type II secretory pathway component PulJ